MYSDYEDSDCEDIMEYQAGCRRGSMTCRTGTCAREMCRRGSCGSGDGSVATLPFDPSSIENVILKLADRFDFKIILQDGAMRRAAIITSGLSIAGSMIGKYYGGKVGAAVGGAVGGLCGVGIVAVSMRVMWPDIKGKLTEIYDIVYDYIAGLGIDDYKMAAKFLMSNNADCAQLAMVIVSITSNILGHKVLSNLTACVMNK